MDREVCRVKITCTTLPTNRFVSTTKISMKYVVNWIPLRIRVRSTNTQPSLTPVAGLNLLQWKVSDSSDSDSKNWDLKIFASNVKVNPVISWNGQNSFQRFFSESSQFFITPQISFEFSGFYYTSNSFPVKPIIMNDRKTCPFREILSQRKGRGEHRVEQCGPRTTKNRMQIIWLGSI